ncbi:NACHT domain-containing protein [Cellulosilyticum sp. I15G10I2]|uniref:NACHT domain-containing protein n=1 Tax=Cellulosilyticum sp. I15G10I2 TaxID=1892843 RepID=UPI00085C6E81|nr:NACHT domain-containing protein [Cellulosilyticum sp. I15G10I2]
MVVENIIVPALINITCAFGYDILKGLGRKIDKLRLEDEVKGLIEDFVHLEIESSAITSFFNEYSTRVAFLNYFYYKSYREASKKKEYSKQGFIEATASKAQEYIQRFYNKQIDGTELKKYIRCILNLIESKLIKDIPKELMGLAYTNSLMIENLEEKIMDLITIDLQDKKEEYEKTRLECINMLKKVNNKSQIYGKGKFDFYQFYVFPKFTQNIKGTKVVIGWKDVFISANMISIIGGPGFGKSLFMQNIINRFEELNIIAPDQILPIYCNLKDYEKFAGTKAYSICEFLRDSLIDAIGIGKDKVNEKFIQYFLEAGRTLILFDALDEVAEDLREKLHEKIVMFIQQMNLNNKVCITARDRGFIPVTDIIYNVQPVDLEQVKEYLHNMSKLGQFDEDDIENFAEQSTELIKQNFLSSFLILSLLVNIFNAELELPENKIELYDKCINYIGKKREIQVKRLPYNFGLIGKILDSDTTFEKIAELAKYNNKQVDKKSIVHKLSTIFERSYHSNNETIGAVNEFIRFCGDRTELIVPTNEEEYFKFYHRSFFEYYYGKHLIKSNNRISDIIDELKKFGYDSEIYDIVSALLKKDYYEKYIEIIHYIFDLVKKDEEYFILLTLMVQISDEPYYIEEYYKLIFNDNEILSGIGRETRISEIIYSILKKSKNAKLIGNNFMTYYKKECIAAYVYIFTNIYSKNATDINKKQLRYKVANLSSVFACFIRDEQYKALVEDVVLSLNKEQFNSIVLEYATPIYRHIREEDVEEDDKMKETLYDTFHSRFKEIKKRGKVEKREIS